MFDFLKKDSGDAPPDVGQEDAFDAIQEKKKPALKKVKGSTKKKVKKTKKISKPVIRTKKDLEVSDIEAGKISKVSVRGAVGGVSKVEVDRLNARVEALQSLLKGFNERFSVVGQQIGEVRAMNLATEKAMSRSNLESAKASDIVKEVKPDKLRLDYQKLDMKMATLSEKIMANNQYAKTVMNEVKGLRHKAGVFLGTDALLQLNDDVKKDLIELQKLSSRVRMNADKSEQLFIESRKGFAASQKLGAMVTNLDSFASDLKEEIDKLKLDHSQIIKQKDFGTFQKNVNNKFLGMDTNVEEVERVKDENERLSRVIEDIFSVVKKNKKDIGNLGMNIGKKGIKKVDDYDNKLFNLLEVMEKIAGEVKEMKRQNLKKIGVKEDSKINSKVKSLAVKKEIVKPTKIGKPSEVRSLEEIRESAKMSIKKIKPLKSTVAKKIAKSPKRVKSKKVFGKNKAQREDTENELKTQIGDIENELKGMKETFKVPGVEKVSSEINKLEEENIVENEKKKVDKNKLKKRKLSKKDKLNATRIRNLKKARAVKKKLREAKSKKKRKLSKKAKSKKK